MKCAIGLRGIGCFDVANMPVGQVKFGFAESCRAHQVADERARPRRIDNLRAGDGFVECNLGVIGRLLPAKQIRQPDAVLPVVQHTPPRRCAVAQRIALGFHRAEFEQLPLRIDERFAPELMLLAGQLRGVFSLGLRCLCTAKGRLRLRPTRASPNA